MDYKKRSIVDYNNNIFSYLFMIVSKYNNGPYCNYFNYIKYTDFTNVINEEECNFKYFSHRKLKVFNEYVNNNKFMFGSIKEKYIESYCKTQRLYFILLRFVKNYKKRKYIKYDLETNFNLIPLSDFNSKFTLEITQNNTIYKFFIPDLLRMWKVSLCNQEDMFEDPIELKNPYTNLNFNKFDLYFIYFTSLQNNIKIPEMVRFFYKCNFDIPTLLLEYATTLREESIITHVSELPFELYEELLVIKNKFPTLTTNLYFYENIQNNIIKRKILTEMRNILISYYIYVYSFNEYKRLKHFKKFKYMLYNFNISKSSYGRKIYKRGNSNNLVLSYNV